MTNKIVNILVGKLYNLFKVKLFSLIKFISFMIEVISIFIVNEFNEDVSLKIIIKDINIMNRVEAIKRFLIEKLNISFEARDVI